MEQVSEERRTSWRRLALLDTGPLRRHRDFRLLWKGQAVIVSGGILCVAGVAAVTAALPRFRAYACET